MRTAILVALAALVAAAGAGAARKPTAKEAKAIRLTVSSFLVMPSTPAAHDNKIVSIFVSKLDKRFASVRLDSKTAGPSDLVLHFSRGNWWVQEFGSSLGCDAAPKAVLSDLKVGCSPPGATAWISNCGPLVAAPRELTLACADAGIALIRMHWAGWGEPTAIGTGLVSENDCNPYCAAGHFHSYPVRATATKLTPCGRARYYAHLDVAYTGKRPPGQTHLVFTPPC